MPLGELHNDLLWEIMEYLSVHNIPKPRFPPGGHFKNHLLSFIRCNRALYTLGEPILYERLIQRTSNTLPHFIRTILTHPNLADHVRVVHIVDGGSRFSPIRDSCPEALFSREELQKIWKAITLSQSHTRWKQISTISSWMSDIENGSWDALAAFVLSQLRNVEDLQIEECSPDDAALDRPLKLFSYSILFAAERTSKLRHIGVSYRKPDATGGLSAIPISILALPSLRSFEGDHIREVYWKYLFLGPAFTFKTLRLDRCNFSAKAIHNLLKACPELEFLKYEHDQWREDAPLNPARFGEAINHLKSNLKELILYSPRLISSNISLAYSNAEDLATIGSLVDFQQLTTLSITSRLLLGPHNHGTPSASTSDSTPGYQSLEFCLPTSLEHLKLKNCEKDIFKHALALIEVKELAVPNLKMVIIEFVHWERSNYFGGFVAKSWRRQLTHCEVNGREAERLEKACSDKGVVLDIWYNGAVFSR